MLLATSVRTRGFTLIEILVSISIVLILLSVAYISFQEARERSNDNAIREQLSLMRIEAERIYRVDRDFTQICEGITSAGIDAELPSGTQFSCLDTGGYAFQADLFAGGSYCVDSFGREREIEIDEGGGVSGSSCSGGDCDCR